MISKIVSSVYVIFNDKGKRNWVNGILQWIE
ncbi:hypothetical protein T4C_12620 [Trichinella pseudospiralis]|uniref:Uncharacterized protein n=1 Tax=Trichinella pseudospiralis TaxID=6337 RepID=A0A0V1G888_TRIPS|nr:hypothetical protein T4C_12620 [Trichinella pseudospiralis]